MRKLITATFLVDIPDEEQRDADWFAARAVKCLMSDNKENDLRSVQVRVDNESYSVDVILVSTS